MSNPEKPKVIHTRLDADLEEKFNKIASYLGMKNESEIIRYLIQQFYITNKNEIEKTLKEKIILEHFNLDENGVKIFDKTNPKQKFIAQVYFKPEGVWCDHCKTDNCKHIQFAIEQPDIQKIIRKKKAEGWKLPEV